MSGTRLTVAEIRNSPGGRRHLEGSLTVEGLGISSAQLVSGASVTYDVDLEVLDDQVTVMGTVRGDWIGSCRRCLEETSGTVEARLTEVFEKRPLEGETWPIEEGRIDLAPALTSSVLLELPVAPLCRPDCAGPDPERYPAFPEDRSESAPTVGIPVGRHSTS